MTTEKVWERAGPISTRKFGSGLRARAGGEHPMVEADSSWLIENQADFPIFKRAILD